MEKNTYNKLKLKEKIILLVILTSTILTCILPMKCPPTWDGIEKDFTKQYEYLADAILEGHLNLDYHDMDEKLLKMKNPYDPKERIKEGVVFHWDHALYKGKYYVYFGIAPVIFTFIPYKLITGNSLKTYHATELYTALFIIGLFCLLYEICKYFYPKLNFTIYALTASALSFLSVWACTGNPTIYSTAIVAGMACAIWSLYFYMKAVYGKKTLNKAILLATIGGFFGALTFACRPPIGLINLLAIPLLIEFFQEYGLNKKTISRVIIVLIPYIIIGTSLMIYNYIRFDSILEFGQSYQLTLADQRRPKNIFSLYNLVKVLFGILYNFTEYRKYSFSFPFVNIGGFFINFPILIIPYFPLYNKKYREKLVNKKIRKLYIGLMILPFIITILDVLNATFLAPRYRLDVYFILSILAFISIACYMELIEKHKQKIIFTSLIVALDVLAIITSILLVFIPCYD